jgi:hypothetical protein
MYLRLDNRSGTLAPTLSTQPRPAFEMSQMGILDHTTMRPKHNVHVQQPSFGNIRGIYPLIANIGYPDITDNTKGGIAIWCGATLRSRGYKFLHRVEIIDEATPSLYPVRHFSNVYIWVRLTLSDTMVDNIANMSTDIFYDKGKQLLIVRSDSLDTAVAQCALIALYANGKVSYYDIYTNSMLLSFYTGIRRPKTRRALYTIVNNLSNR